jgi:hypothetical protein
MEKIKVIKDIVGGTLTVWFGNPEDKHVCEEAGDGIVLMKDASGNVIGFEHLCCGSSSEDLNIETLIVKTAS